MKTNWRQDFTGFTGQMAFVLSLSRNMILGLSCLHHQKPLYEFTGHFVPIHCALQRRGLIQHNMCIELNEDEEPREKYWWSITPAGELVIKLLMLAGQIPETLIKENAS